MALRPRFSANARVAMTSAPAPSQMPLAAPAWITPSFLKTLGSLASVSSVVSGRLCSSFAKLIIEFFLPGTSSGAISAERRPASCAAAKRFWLSTLYSSTSRCEMPYFTARFSAVIAIGSPL